MQWLNADSVHADSSLTMRLRVTDGGTVAPGARLTFPIRASEFGAVLYPSTHRWGRQRRDPR